MGDRQQLDFIHGLCRGQAGMLALQPVSDAGETHKGMGSLAPSLAVKGTWFSLGSQSVTLEMSARLHKGYVSPGNE